MRTNDFSTALAALCLAVNEREHLKRFNNSAEYAGNETVWLYVGTARPSASDFSIALRGNADVLDVLNQLHDAIDNLADRLFGEHFSFVTKTQLIDGHSGDYWDGTYNASRGVMYAGNWLSLKEALDRLTVLYVTVMNVTPSEVLSDFEFQRNGSTGVAESADAATIWTHRTDDPSLAGGQPYIALTATKYLDDYQPPEGSCYLGGGFTRRFFNAKFNAPLYLPYCVFGHYLGERATYGGEETISVSPPTVTYTLGGSSVSPDDTSFDLSFVSIGEDFDYVMEFTSDGDFSGAAPEPAGTSSAQWDAAAISGDTWAYEVSSLLTDQA